MKVCIFFIIFSLFFVPNLMSDSYYTWVDENGVTHITDTPKKETFESNNGTQRNFGVNQRSSSGGTSECYNYCYDKFKNNITKIEGCVKGCQDKQYSEGYEAGVKKDSYNCRKLCIQKYPNDKSKFSYCLKRCNSIN